MKVTDMFTLFHKSNPVPPGSAKGGGVKPVTIIDKMALQPGQLLHGEVLGEDGRGNLLLKIGGEIISTRGLASMATGQQVWVEVKEVGDSPLFALAHAKGVIHDLLKNIMEVRPALLTQGKSGVEVAPEFQTPINPSPELSFVPKLAPVQADGGLPRETTQLLKALLSIGKLDLTSLPETKNQGLRPFLVPETGQLDVGKVATVLAQTGKIPPVLIDLPPLRPLVIFPGERVPQIQLPKQQPSVSPDSTPAVVQTRSDLVAFVQPPMAPLPKGVRSQIIPQAVHLKPSVSEVRDNLAPVPFITEEGQVVAHAVAVVRSILAAVPLVQNADGGQGKMPVEQVSKGFAALVKSILVEGKIPESLRNVEPVQQLLVSARQPGVSGVMLQPTTVDDLIKGFSELTIDSKVLSPANHNETVAKVLSGLQGREAKPEMLKVLKQLVSAQPVLPHGDGEGGGESTTGLKQHEAMSGLAKVATFFQSQALVNQEVALTNQGECVLVPCFFTGQSGWGEWLWSHESGQESGESQENLVFFLEMSNLGPVSIQASLSEKSLAGQFQVADGKAYSLIIQRLPKLRERLENLGYETHLTCRQKPVSVMQDIKDSLESRTHESAPTSLVDIQA